MWHSSSDMDYRSTTDTCGIDAQSSAPLGLELSRGICFQGLTPLATLVRLFEAVVGISHKRQCHKE